MAVGQTLHAWRDELAGEIATVETELAEALISRARAEEAKLDAARVFTELQGTLIGAVPSGHSLPSAVAARLGLEERAVNAAEGSATRASLVVRNIEHRLVQLREAVVHLDRALAPPPLPAPVVPNRHRSRREATVVNDIIEFPMAAQ
jgi:hypothetical protein